MSKVVKKNHRKIFKKKVKPCVADSIPKLINSYADVDVSKVKYFSDFPLSQKTLKGLTKSGYTEPTEIQRDSILLGLQGHDILGAAKTGSGKTLAFLIPVLECLYCKQWQNWDGIGALIITPVRELAYQIFETLRKIGVYHDFSAGLIIGGKDLHFEKKRLDQCNIMICTPGRLLQHMDENPLLTCDSLQILVLDEADRCLDMGFEETMNNIIANLPKKRQTLLFSATQTKSVRDLARLSLKFPKYVSVHEHAKYSTPESLVQSYVVCELHEKLSLLWSFIKNHLKQKILVFMSSCKQVKYHYEMFCRLRPGTTLLALYGSLHQLKRMAIYDSFCQKSHAVLFATDIAARGLDFPAVHWVVQLDCPEDANTYIHRAGRTARYQNNGESLLVLLSSEEDAMLEQLTEKKIPISKIQVNALKLMNPQRKMEAFLAKDPNLKASAQRAFVSYVKAVFLMKNKAVFNVNALNTDEYARSLGLAIPPRIRFLQKIEKNKLKQKRDAQNKTQENLPETPETKDTHEDKISYSESEESEKNVKSLIKPTQMSKDSYKFELDESESDSEGEIFSVKRRNHDLELEPLEPDIDTSFDQRKSSKVLTKAAVAKKMLKKKIVPNKKTVFTEEGEAVVNKGKEKMSQLAKQYEAENEGGIDVSKAKEVLKEEDKFDKQLFRERIKEKHKALKKKLRSKKEKIEGDFSESGEESEDNVADLSWLPDPDKVYGMKNKSDNSSEDEIHIRRETEDGHTESEDNDDNDDDFQSVHRPLPLKRHLAQSKKKLKKKFMPYKNNEKLLDTNLSIKEEEELALHFLKSR